MNKISIYMKCRVYYTLPLLDEIIFDKLFDKDLIWNHQRVLSNEFTISQSTSKD